MKLLVQLVNKASVTVDEKIIGKIDKGYLVFLGVSDADNIEIAD